MKKIIFPYDQPQEGIELDLNNSITRKMVVCISCCPPAERPLNLVNMKDYGFSPVRFGKGKYGRNTESSAGSQGPLPEWDFSSGAWTVGVLFKVIGLATANSLCQAFGCSTYTSETDNEGFRLGVDDTSGTFRFIFTTYNNNGAANYNLKGTTSPGAGRDYLIFGTSDGTTRKIWVDGKFENSTTGSPNPAVNVSSTLRLGHNAGTGGINNAYIAFAWKRQLSYIEINRLTNNPYCIFNPIRKKILFSSPSQAADNKTSTITQALISVIANTTTASKQVNKTATLTQALITITTGTTAGEIPSGVDNKTATTTQALVSIITNTTSASKGVNKTSDLVQSLISVITNTTTASRLESRTASLTVQNISIITNTTTASRLESRTSTTVQVSITIIANDLTCSKTVSKIATLTQGLIQIITGTLSANSGVVSVDFGITLLRESRIEKQPVFNSRISKFIEDESPFENRLTLNSQIIH